MAQTVPVQRLARLPAAAWELLLSPTVGLLAILLLTVAFYAPSLDDWFYADDFWFLRHSQTTGWGTWLAQAFDFRHSQPVREFNEFRPLYVLTFRAEYSLFGLHAAPYHAVNLAVHLANVVLFWHLARRLTDRVWAAHLAAAVFALHFAYGDAVRWVVNGNTLFATLCYLLAFIMFIKYTDAGPPRFWYYGAFLLAFTAALLYHAVTAPLAVALVAWYFLLHRRPVDVLRPLSWLPFAPVALVVAPYVVIQEWVHQHYANLAIGFQIGWHMYDTYIDYLSLSAYPLSLAHMTSPYISAVLFVITAFLLTQWRWSPLAVFVVIWYISALAPDSTLIFGAFGRLLYLPGLALALVVTVAAMRLVDLASSGTLKAPLARVREALPYLGLAAILPAVLLLVKLHDIASKTAPSFDNTIGRQAAANHEFVHDLRGEFPTLPNGGTLYVVSPPFNLIIFTDAPLDNLIELYYGEVEVKSVPLKGPPFWNEAQVQAALRPQDRLFTFERDR